MKRSWLIPCFVAVLASAVATPARACAVCFGAPGSDVNNAMAWAIIFMLIILAAVLGAFVGFFFYLRNRANHLPPE